MTDVQQTTANEIPIFDLDEIDKEPVHRTDKSSTSTGIPVEGWMLHALGKVWRNVPREGETGPCFFRIELHPVDGENNVLTHLRSSYRLTLPSQATSDNETYNRDVFKAYLFCRAMGFEEVGPLQDAPKDGTKEEKVAVYRHNDNVKRAARRKVYELWNDQSDKAFEDQGVFGRVSHREGKGGRIFANITALRGEAPTDNPLLTTDLAHETE